MNESRVYIISWYASSANSELVTSVLLVASGLTVGVLLET